MHQLTAAIHYPLDLAGIFAFALCGALLAVRKDFGLFGTVVLAEVTGLGGGLFRDTVLGVTPIAFTDLGYALAPVGAAAIVFFSLTAQRHPMVCEVLDAAALGLFSVTGTMKGLAHGFGPLPSVALGVATAVGGGTFSSVLAREIPPVLRWDQDLYALPAVTGAGGVGALHGMRMLTVPTAVWVGIAAFVIRLLALHFHWRAPRSLVWRSRQPTGFPSPPAAVPALQPTLPPHQNLEHTLRMRSSDVSPHARGREHTLQLRLPTVEGPAARRTPTHRTHTAHHRAPAHGRDDFPIRR
ncbi:trimeric intracellular cation channel family protein [Streptomyces sp. HD1123-B1]|uniref:trimeric intracellular cation channel family protein n=1 Tax=Streptomyces huangiella TaxID=3228804 RepID=UPI003D7EBF5F